MCSIRLYYNNEMIVGDMDIVKDLDLQRVEVEVYCTLHFSVSGKGSSYTISIDVNPNESLEIIRSKVPFFKMFSQRRYTLESESGEVFEESQFTSLKFRDSGLKNNSKLVMKEPSRQDAGQASQEEQEQSEPGSPAVIFGEGEEGKFGGEGGEDEMVEMEGGEDEMVEEG